MAANRKLDERIAAMQERNRRNRRRVATLGTIVAVVVAAALIVPAMSATRDSATTDAGFFFAGSIDETASSSDAAADAGEAGNGESEAAEGEGDSVAAGEGDASNPDATADGVSDASADAMPAQSFVENVLDESDGVSVAMNVMVDAPQGALPAGTTMRVQQVTDSDVLSAAKAEAVDAADIDRQSAQVMAVDIAFFDASGEEIEPAAPVRVILGAPEVSGIARAEDVAVVHVDDDLNAEALASDDVTLKRAREEVAFDAEQFSVYAIVYTVDFHFTDESTGKAYETSIFGGTSVTLHKLLPVLGVVDAENVDSYLAEITGVEFSDPSLVAVEYLDPATSGYSYADWRLMSLEAFDTTERLDLTRTDGSNVTIWVTDDQTTLTDMVNAVSLQVDDKTAPQPWEVYAGVDYTMSISFGENGSRQFPSGGNTISMPAPSGLHFRDGDSGTFDIPAGLAGTITGNRWEVRGDQLYIYFAEDPDDILTRSSTVRFDLNVTVNFDPNATDIKFNDRVDPKVNVNSNGKATVSKTGSYNAQTGQIDYVVTVKSSGNTENVKVTDEISGNVLTIDAGSIEVDPASAGNASTKGNGFELTIPSMAHSDVVTIRYSADVDFSMLGADYKLSAEDGKNTVKAQPEKGDGDETTYTFNNEIKYSNVTKSSSKTETDEDGNPIMTWTIVANKPAVASIAGAKITDAIEWGSKDVMTYVKDGSDVKLEVKVYDESGNLVDTRSNEKATVTGGNGSPETWTYTIPDSDKDKKYAYEITYQTVVDKDKAQAANAGTVRNNVSNDHGGSSSGTGIVPGVNPGGNGGQGGGTDGLTAVKSVKETTSEYTDWDIVVVVPKEGLDSLAVVDDLPWQHSDAKSGGYGLVDTFDSVVGITGLVEGEHIGENEPTITTSNDKWLKDADGNYVERQIATFNFSYEDENGTGHTGLKATGADRTVTITIRTKNNEGWMKAATLNDYLVSHTNNARVNNTSVSATARPVLSTVKKTGAQSSRPDFAQRNAADGDIYYAYDVQLTNVTADKLPLTIEDSFDPTYLEFVSVDDYRYQNGQKTDQQTSKQDIYIQYGENDYSKNSNGQVPAFEADNAAGKLKITVSEDNLATREDGSYYPYYHIRYYLRVPASKVEALQAAAIANKGTFTLANTAMWDGISDTTTIDYTVPAVDKDGWFHDSIQSGSNERRYDFVVDINPERLKLNNGQKLTFDDMHTANLSVDYSSFAAYKVRDGKTYTKAQLKAALQQSKTTEIEENLELVDRNEISWNFNGNVGHFEGFQDETHYLIYYSALVVGSGNQSFSNEVDMEGYYSSHSDTRYYNSNTSGAAEVYQIQLLKHEAGKTSNGLAGATFQLFMDDGAGNPIPMTYGDTPVTRGEVADQYLDTGGANVVGQPITFTTNNDGYLLVALNQNSHGAQLEEGVHYYLKEVGSPVGYKIDSSVEYWSFTLTMDPDEVNYGGRDANGVRQWIYFYYDDILKMSNTQVEENETVTINVDKKWYDASGNVLEGDALDGKTATVKLFKQTDGVWAEDGEEITLPKDDGSWSHSFLDLPRKKDGHIYDYKVEEVGVPTGYVSSTNMRETESDGQTTRTYSISNYEVKAKNTSLQVKKQWFDANGNERTADLSTATDLPDSIGFTLYRVVSSVPFASQPTAGGAPFDIPINGITHDQGHYTLTMEQYIAGVDFGELPLVSVQDNKATYYAYYIKEDPVVVTEADGSVTKRYKASTSTTETEEGTTHILAIQMENKTVPKESDTSLTVKKEWFYQGASLTSGLEPVTFKLYQVASSEPLTNPQNGGRLYDAKNSWGGYDWSWNHVSDGTYQLGVNNNWSAITFSNLPEVRVDDQLEPTYYSYYVVEEPIEGFDTSYTRSDDGKTVAIRNDKQPRLVDIPVSKSWKDQGSVMEWPADTKVVVSLYRNGVQMTTTDANGVSQPITVELTSDSPSSVFEALPAEDASGNPYIYTVQEEVQKLSGDTWQTITSIGDKGIATDIQQTSDGGFAITNDLRGPGKLIVTKSFAGTELTDEQKANVTFTVYEADGTTPAVDKDGTEVGSRKYSDMENGRWEIDNLPTGTYVVKETNANIENDGKALTRTTAVKVNGRTVASSAHDDGASASVTLGTSDATVAFTNTYGTTQLTGNGSITVEKKWAPGVPQTPIPVSLYRAFSDSKPSAYELANDLNIESQGIGQQVSISYQFSYDYYWSNHVTVRSLSKTFSGKAGDIVKITLTAKGGSLGSATVTPGSSNGTSPQINQGVDFSGGSAVVYAQIPYYSWSSDQNWTFTLQWVAEAPNELDVSIEDASNDSEVNEGAFVDLSISDEASLRNVEAIRVDSGVLEESNKWKVGFNNLPTTTDDGKYYVYYVIEEGGEAYNATYSESNGVVTITNKAKPQETIDLNVEKVWKNQNDVVVTAARTGSADFELYQIAHTTTESSMSEGDGSGFTKMKVSLGDGIADQETGAGIAGNPITFSFNVTFNSQDQKNAFIKRIDEENNSKYDKGVKLVTHYYEYDSYSGAAVNRDRFPTIVSGRDSDELALVIKYEIPTTGADTLVNGKVPKSILVHEIKWDDCKSHSLTSDGISIPTTPGEVQELELTRLYEQFSVSDATDWKKAFEKLPKKSSDGKTTYSYFVKEINVPEGVTVAYEPVDPEDESQSAATDTNNGKIKVTNTTTVTEPEKVQIGAVKQWDDPHSEGHPATSFILMRKIAAEDDATGSGMPRTYAAAVAAGYSVVQVSDGTAVLHTHFAGADPADSDVAFANPVTVPAGSMPSASSSPSLGDAAGAAWPDSVTWSGLDAQDGEGNTYRYVVVENVPAGYTLSDASESAPAVSDDGHSFLFTNKADTTGLTVSKKWLENGTQIDPGAGTSITYKVMQVSYADPLRSTEVEGTVDYPNPTEYPLGLTSESTAGMLSASNDWTQTLANLPKFSVDANGAITYFSYYVVEDDVVSGKLTLNGKAFDVTYSAGAGGVPQGDPKSALANGDAAESEIAITNGSYNVEIGFRKVDVASESPLDGASFVLQRLATGEKWETVMGEAGSDATGKDSLPKDDYKRKLAIDGSFTIREGTLTEGAFRLSGLENGIYRLREIEAPTGYVIEDDYPIIFEVANGAVRANKGAEYFDGANNVFAIPNTAGQQLPTTGGIGTAPFIVGGIALIALAAFLLLRGRRK